MIFSLPRPQSACPRFHSSCRRERLPWPSRRVGLAGGGVVSIRRTHRGGRRVEAVGDQHPAIRRSTCACAARLPSMAGPALNVPLLMVKMGWRWWG